MDIPHFVYPLMPLIGIWLVSTFWLLWIVVKCLWGMFVRWREWEKDIRGKRETAPGYWNVLPGLYLSALSSNFPVFTSQFLSKMHPRSLPFPVTDIPYNFPLLCAQCTVAITSSPVCSYNTLSPSPLQCLCTCGTHWQNSPRSASFLPANVTSTQRPPILL